MQISASSARLSSVHTTATTRIIVLWIGSWLVAMRRTPLWISAPTASPSVRSKDRDQIAAATAAAVFLDEILTRGYDIVIVSRIYISFYDDT